MKTDPVIIFMFWFIIWPFWALFPLVCLSSRGINLNILLFFSLSYLFLKLTFWFWWRFRACSLIIRSSTVPKPLPFRPGSGRTFFYYFTSQICKLGHNSVSAKSSKLLFRHVCKSGCSCCFWLEHAFALTKYVRGSGCNTGKSRFIFCICHVQNK